MEEQIRADHFPGNSKVPEGSDVIIEEFGMWIRVSKKSVDSKGSQDFKMGEDMDMEDFDDEMADLLIKNYKNLTDIRKTMTELSSSVDMMAKSDGFKSQAMAESSLIVQGKQTIGRQREGSISSAKSGQRGNSRSRQLPKITKH